MKPCLGLSAFASIFAVVSAASADDICYDLVEPIFRPSVTKSVERCLNDDWTCLLHFNCCLPGCEFDPICVTSKLVTTPSYYETVTCDLTGQELIAYAISGLITLSTPDGLGDIGLVNEFVDLAYTLVGEPLPDDLINLLIAIGNSPLAADLRYPSADQIKRLRVALMDDVLGSLATTLHKNGMGIRDLILLDSGKYSQIMTGTTPSFEQFACNEGVDGSWRAAFGTFLHEMVHTMQSDNLGDGYLSVVAFDAIAAPVLHAPLEQWVKTLDDREADGVACPTDVVETPEEMLIIDDPLTGTSSIQLRALPLYASGNIKLNDRAEIRSGFFEECTDTYGRILFDCRASIASGGTTYVGNDVRFRGVLSEGLVDLRARTSLSGSAFSTSSITTEASVEIGGICEELDLTMADQLSDFSPSFPTFTSTVAYLPPDSNVYLPPGAYANLSVPARGVVHLSAGTYEFDTVGVESQGQLAIDTSAGPVRIFIQSHFMLHGDISGNAAEILWGYAGSTPLYIGGKLQGTLVAPRAWVDLQSRNVPWQEASHVGAVYARGIELHQQAHFHYAPFNHPWLP